MTKTLINLLLFIAILIVGGLGWYMYSQNQSLNLNILQESAASTDLQADISLFLSRQATMRSIDLPLDILDDQRLQSLQTVTGEVPALDRGRSNPFATSN